MVAVVAVVISSIALATIVIISIVGYNKANTIESDYNSKMRDVVDQVNTAQYYEYEFDKKNKTNLNDLNINLDTVKNTYVKKDELAKQVNVSSAEISGVAKINQLKVHPNTYNEKIPEGWGGGIHSWDVYANGTVGAGTKGSINAYMNSAGNIGASRNINVGGDIVANGGNNWIIHTPDDGKRSMHMAPSKTANQQDWDWNNQTVFNADGKMKTNKLQLGDKFQLSGVGEAHGNDGWLRVFNKDGTDYYGGVAAANLWSRDGASIGGTTNTNKINTTQGISVGNVDPGPLVEKNYGKDSDRYGVGQWPNGTTRLYAATAYPGTVNLSLAKDNNTFDDVVSVKPNRDVNINGTIKTPNSHTIESAGRQHISAGELLYLLPKNGVMITKDWGANGNLRVDGDATFNGKQVGVNPNKDDWGWRQYNANGGNVHLNHGAGYGLYVNTNNQEEGKYAMQLDNNKQKVMSVFNDGRVNIDGDNAKFCIQGTCINKSDLDKIRKTASL